MNNNQQQFQSFVPDWVKPLLLQVQQKYGVPATLLASQIKHESGFNPNAVNVNTDLYQSTDHGIAQINNHWHPEISEQQANNPQWAINWMAQKMAEKYSRYGDWAKALSEYNTGNPTQGVETYAKRILTDVPGMENHIPTAMPTSTPTPTSAQPKSSQQTGRQQAQSPFQPMMDYLQNMKNQQDLQEQQKQSIPESIGNHVKQLIDGIFFGGVNPNLTTPIPYQQRLDVQQAQQKKSKGNQGQKGKSQDQSYAPQAADNQQQSSITPFLLRGKNG